KTIIYRGLGNVELAARNFTNAIRWYKEAIWWEPHHTIPYGSTGKAYEAMGDYTNALDWFERDELLQSNDKADTKQRYTTLRRALAEGGIIGYWQQQWKYTQSYTNGDFYWKAAIQIHLGNTNAALDCLNESFAKGERIGYQPPLSLLLYD